MGKQSSSRLLMKTWKFRDNAFDCSWRKQFLSSFLRFYTPEHLTDIIQNFSSHNIVKHNFFYRNRDPLRYSSLNQYLRLDKKRSTDSHSLSSKSRETILKQILTYMSNHKRKYSKGSHDVIFITHSSLISGCARCGLWNSHRASGWLWYLGGFSNRRVSGELASAI